MLRTLAINSNKKCVKFWCFDSFFITKAIWVWGEFVGIYARSIPGQGVLIHHRRASGQHIRVGIIPGCRHLHPDARRHLHPVAANLHLAAANLHSATANLYPAVAISTRMFTSGILTSDRKGERFNFSGRTYPDPLIAPTRMGEQPFCIVLRCSPEASWYLPPTFWDILRYFALDICCLNPQNLLVTHQS